MRLAEHVARMRDENECNILVGNLKGKNHLEELGVDGKVLLKWTLGK
jgi:hypothetical protein